jgi:hypothetical protein
MTRATAKMLAWLYANPARSWPRGAAFFPSAEGHSARSLRRYARPACGRAKPDDPQGFAASPRACIRWIHRPHAAMMNASNFLNEHLTGLTMTDMTIKAVRTTMIRVPWPDTPWLKGHAFGEARNLLVLEVETKGGIVGMGYLFSFRPG